MLPASSLPTTLSAATLAKNRPSLAPPVKRAMKAATLEKKLIFQQTVCFQVVRLLCGFHPGLMLTGGKSPLDCHVLAVCTALIMLGGGMVSAGILQTAWLMLKRQSGSDSEVLLTSWHASIRRGVNPNATTSRCAASVHSHRTLHGPTLSRIWQVFCHCV